MKRFLSIILSCALVSSVLPFSAFAEEGQEGLLYEAYEDFDYSDINEFYSADSGATSKGFGSPWTGTESAKDYMSIADTDYGKALQINKFGQFEFQTTLGGEAFSMDTDKDYYITFFAYVSDEKNPEYSFNQSVRINDNTKAGGVLYDAQYLKKNTPYMKWGGGAETPPVKNTEISPGNYYRVVYKLHASTSSNRYVQLMVYPADEDASVNWDMTKVLDCAPTLTDVFWFSTGSSQEVQQFGDLRLNIYSASEQELNTEAEAALSDVYSMVLNGDYADDIDTQLVPAEEKVTVLTDGIAKETLSGAVERLKKYSETLKKITEYADGGEAVSPDDVSMVSDISVSDYFVNYISAIEAYNKVTETENEDDFWKAMAYAQSLSGAVGEGMQARLAELSSKFVNKKAQLASETFDNYSVGALSFNEAVTKPDIMNGFLSGWCGDSQLAAAVSNDFYVNESKQLECPGGSYSLYRKMSSPIDLGKDGVYYISWKMKVSADTADGGGYYQRLFFSNPGVTAMTDELTFGYSRGTPTTSRPKNFLRYSRILSNLILPDVSSNEIVPGKLYDLEVRVKSSKDDTDTISFTARGEDGSELSAMTAELDSNKSFSLLGYNTWIETKDGSDPNVLDDISIEFYDSAAGSLISEIEAAIEEAKKTLSKTELESLSDRIAGLPDGAMKESLSDRVSNAIAYIEYQEQETAKIEAEINRIITQEIDESNYEEMQSAIRTLAQRITELASEAARSDLEQKLIPARNKITEAAMQLTKTVLAENIGWATDTFKADKELEINDLPSGVSAGNCGPVSFAAAAEVYRGISMPVKRTDGQVYYLQLKAKTSKGGEAYAQLGDIKLGMSANPYITVKGDTARSALGIVPDKDYTLIAQIEKDKITLYPFASDSGYDGKSAVSLSCLSWTESSVLCLGGADSVISDFIKEELTEEYVKTPLELMNAMTENVNVKTVNAALESINGIADSGFKTLVGGCVQTYSSEIANTAPIVLSVGIEGTGNLGSTVTAKYNILDTYGNLDRVEVKWYKGGAAVGSSESFKLSSDCAGASISCEVTAYNTAGIASKAVRSASMKIQSSGTSSGSVSYGGGSISAPVPQYFLKEQEENGQSGENNDGAEPKTGFKDIEGHWAKDSVMNMYEAGIVNGVSENEFKPDDNITRAEFAAILVRALKLEEKAESIEFNDVGATDWYYEAVQIASSNGLVNGDNNNFFPERSLSREEMAKMVVNAYSLIKNEANEAAAEIMFSDAEQLSSWSVEYVKKAVGLKLISGFDDGSFHPGEQTTRAQAVVVMERLLGL